MWRVELHFLVKGVIFLQLRSTADSPVDLSKTCLRQEEGLARVDHRMERLQTGRVRRRRSLHHAFLWER